MAKNKRKTFSEIVSDAVNDLSEHGFDSEERIKYWTEQIRIAAEEQMTSQAKMERMLREGLTEIYKQIIDNGQYRIRHPGVSIYTIDNIKAELRAELSKRIYASADLIRLNKQQMVDKTIRRFSGWAMSVPPGGAAPRQKPEVKDNIKKALQSQTFEERRVLIDQGHKLTASINNIIAENGGALAVKWRSHWRQAGYNYRPDHKERDMNIYVLRDCWAVKDGLVKAGEYGFYDKITAVAEEPFCRCWAEYVYSIGKLPDDCLTAKGRKKLADVRAKMKAA